MDFFGKNSPFLNSFNFDSIDNLCGNEDLPQQPLFYVDSDEKDDKIQVSKRVKSIRQLKNNEKNQLNEAEIDLTEISDHNVYDISNISNINNKEILKSDLTTEHNNPQDISFDSHNPDLFECYYCDELSCTDNKMDYERHVVLNHPNKLSYPSLADLKKMNISPKEKKWEI